MTLWFHSTILANSLAACVAVGFASASIYTEVGTEAAAKTDRLPLSGTTDKNFVTVEIREDGLSVLNRMPIIETN